MMRACLDPRVVRSHVVALVFGSTALTACTYTAQAPVNPSYNVYTSYQDRLPGKYALVVDGEQLAGDFKVRGTACSFHTYPLDAREAFKISVARTFEQLVEEVDVTDRPLNQAEMLAGGYVGLIRVSGEQIDVDLVVIPGFWTHQMEAEVQMTAALVVDGPDGRLLGTRVSADGGGC
jgi:hypothetical protein